MGIDMKAIAIHFRTAVVASIRVSFRLIRSHPFVVVTAVLSLLAYRFLPSTVTSFVLSSPVIVCTALLLGILLSVGQRNAPEAEEQAEKTDSTIPSSKAEHAADDLVLKKTESFDVRKNLRNRVGPAEKAKVELGPIPGEQGDDALIGEKKVAAEQGFVEKIGIHEDKKGGRAERQEKRIDESSSGIPGAHLVDHGDSDSESTGSSLSGASMADMETSLDEIHPLLDDEASQQPAPPSSNDSGSESSSDEAIEDAENQDDVEEDEEAQEDGTEAVVSWTADDEKNLIDLGTSELERNQRLENLIAKRIASKKQRAAAAEKNLIDLDSNEPLPVSTPVIDHYAHIQIQVPTPVFSTKHNPFDLPYSPIPGLPPVPGSAPSVLLPRRNPFDLPYVQRQGGNPMGVSQTQVRFEPTPQREMFFRRHESFTLGGSAPMEIKQERRQSSNLKPYFVAERVVVNEDAQPTLQRQLIGESDSKSSSVPESDVSSSGDDEVEDREKLNEQESNLGAQPSSRTEQEENEYSEEADSMETQPDRSYVGDIVAQETGSNASDDIDEMNEDGSSSSPSIQSDVKIFETHANEQSSGYHAAGQGAPSTASIAPVRVVREVLESTDYGPLKEPVYDSSPSAATKSSSNVSSIAEGVSSPVPVERTIPLDLEGESKRIAFIKKQWVASTSLSFVDRNESRSKEVSEVREADVIQAVLESSTEAKPLEIHFVHPQAISDGMTDATSSEESGISIEESAARPPFEGGHKESQRKPTDETMKDDIETKEITQSSSILEIEPGNLGDKSASELVDENIDAVNKNLDDSNEVKVNELVREIDEALQANEEIMKSALLGSIDERAISTDAQEGITGIERASESQVGSSASCTDKHHLEPPAEIHSDAQALGARSPEDIHLDLKQQKPISSDDRPVKDEEIERPPEPLIHAGSAAEVEAALKKSLSSETPPEPMLHAQSEAEVEAALKKSSPSETPPEPLLHTQSEAEVEAALKKSVSSETPPEPVPHTQSEAEVEAALKKLCRVKHLQNHCYTQSEAEVEAILKKIVSDDKSVTGMQPDADNNKEGNKETDGGSSSQESKN